MCGFAGVVETERSNLTLRAREFITEVESEITASRRGAHRRLTVLVARIMEGKRFDSRRSPDTTVERREMKPFLRRFGAGAERGGGKGRLRGRPY